MLASPVATGIDHTVFVPRSIRTVPEMSVNSIPTTNSGPTPQVRSLEGAR